MPTLAKEFTFYELKRKERLGSIDREIYFLTDVDETKFMANGISLALYGDEWKFSYTTRRRYDANESIYIEMSDYYISKLENKHLFLKLFLFGLERTL